MAAVIDDEVAADVGVHGPDLEASHGAEAQAPDALQAMVQHGRLNVPVWVIDLYGGLGLGGFHYDAEASGSVSAD